MWLILPLSENFLEEREYLTFSNPFKIHEIFNCSFLNLKVMKKEYTSELQDTFVAIGIVLGFFAIMAAIAFLTGF